MSARYRPDSGAGGCMSARCRPDSGVGGCMSARCRPDSGASGCITARCRPSGLAYLARYRRDLQPMTPLLVGCVRSLKPVAPLLSEISLRWGVVGRPRCRWTVTAHGRASRRRAEPHISDLAPLVWRAPEGPEGTGGLRGAAPNDVRSPSLAGGRGLRRPEHPWGNKQHRNTSGATSTAERRSLRTPRSKRDPGRPGDRRGGQVR